jgi:hypothetical protein
LAEKDVLQVIAQADYLRRCPGFGFSMIAISKIGSGAHAG